MNWIFIFFFLSFFSLFLIWSQSWVSSNVISFCYLGERVFFFFFSGSGFKRADCHVLTFWHKYFMSKLVCTFFFPFLSCVLCFLCFRNRTYNIITNNFLGQKWPEYLRETCPRKSASLVDERFIERWFLSILYIIRIHLF